MHQVHGIKYAWPALIILALYVPISLYCLRAAIKQARAHREWRQREWERIDRGCDDDDCACRDYTRSLRK